MSKTRNELVLVTGATGFLASHIIKQLLEENYRVRGTVSCLHDKEKYEYLYKYCPGDKSNLEFVQTDLAYKEGWEQAVKGCTYVIHTDTPMPFKPPDREEETLVLAVDGVRYLLLAAIKEGVKKFILTSSYLTMWFANEERIVTEHLMADEECVSYYAKNMLCVEKAAREIWNEYRHFGMEFTILNCAFLFGPILKSSGYESEKLMAMLLNGGMRFIPSATLCMVDVRDCARAHIKAMKNHHSNGRYIIAAESMSFDMIATIMKDQFGKYGYKIPKFSANWLLLKLASLFDSNSQFFLPFQGKVMLFNNRKSIEELGIYYRPGIDTILDMCKSLIKEKIVPDKRGFRRLRLSRMGISPPSSEINSSISSQVC